MVPHNMITNCPNSKGDSYFVNSQIKLTDDMQKDKIMLLKMDPT